MDGQCALCALNNSERICKNTVGKGPAFCSTKLYRDVIDRAWEEYEKPDIARFAAEAARQEASAYARDKRTGMLTPIKPRIVETMDFCRRMGYQRVGLAFCGALHSEAATVSKILKAHGVDYQLMPAEENKDLARSYGILQAPSLVVIEGSKVSKLAGLPSIQQYLENA